MNLFERAMEHSWGRWVWFLSFLALAVYVFSGIEISSPPPSPQLSTTALDSRSLNERQMHDALGIGTQTIASLRVGDRVLAVNPQVTAEERASYVEPDWNDWLKISLVLPKPDGSNLEIEILRPDDWFIDQYSLEVHPAETVANKNQAELFDYSLATQATTFPFPSLPNFAFEYQQQSVSYGQASPTLKDEKIASTSGAPLRPAFAELERQLTLAARNDYEPVCLVVQMDLPEMGLTGEAIVTNIQAAPAVRSGNGRVVTATFKHSSGDCINLALSSNGTAETIGTTSNHPFWSVDRQDYVQAGSLQLDERVQTYSGDTKRVISKLARPGPEPVYNLEVHGEHVYYIGVNGVLVHNTGKDVYVGGADGVGAPNSTTTTRSLYGDHSTPGRIDYGSIDPSTGNRSGTRARITRDMVGPEGPGTSANNSIRPPGFESGLPPTRHARGHLHGNQLGGSGDVPENLVTLWQNPVNHPQMSGFEAQVRAAVESGEVVYYFAKPIYGNGPGLPSAVRLRARGSGGFRLDVTLDNVK